MKKVVAVIMAIMALANVVFGGNETTAVVWTVGAAILTWL